MRVQPLREKYSAFAVGQITAKDSHILSREEGRWPSSRTLGQVAVDVDAPLTNGAEAYGEDVWSCRQENFLNYFKSKFSHKSTGPH
jgi:hypothetical protein